MSHPNLISTLSAWKEEYKKDKSKVWVRVILSTGEQYYFTNYDDWYKIKEYCDTDGVSIVTIILQYRSNMVAYDLKDGNGAYLVRSLLGKIGSEAIQTMTIGKVVGEEVQKKVWSLPELMERDSYNNSFEECFKEALILWR